MAALGQSPAPISVIPNSLQPGKIVNPYTDNPPNGGTTQGSVKTQFPMAQNDGQLIPLQSQAYNQNNNSVQDTSPVQGATDAATLNLLQNPSGSFNPQEFKQNSLEQNDVNTASAMEAARQQLGNTSQNGELQNGFLQNALTATQNRSNLAASIDYQSANKQVSDMINALAQGRAQQTTDTTGLMDQLNYQLQKQGINFAEIEQQVQDGIMDPRTAYDYVVKSLSSNGGGDVGKYGLVDTQAANEKQNAMNSVLAQQQYALTHAGTKDDTGAPLVDNQGNLTAAGINAYEQSTNKALYGEPTTQDLADKANAGYKTSDDLPTASQGDKFNITSTAIYNGKTIPPGKYTTQISTYGTGEKVWGTYQQHTVTKLVNTATGGAIEISNDAGKTEGNLVSQLWAGTNNPNNSILG